ncbi:MAG: aminoacyl-tRNA hydrolase [Bacteroidia bacterium]
MKFLIVGLGNIGVDYENTRHNIGFDVLDNFVKKMEIPFSSDRLANYTLIKLKGKQLHCIKPTTYMNLSGKAVLYWANKLKIERQNILIIADDLALPLAKLRLRSQGSDAGHNGLKNINEVFNTNEYPRLRFGIGNNFNKGEQVNFVLSKWNEKEIEAVNKGIENAIKAIELFVVEGCERAMNKVNSE